MDEETTPENGARPASLANQLLITIGLLVVLVAAVLLIANLIGAINILG
jgi:hypothetical protein